jgi:hypothetical protein
MHRDAFSGMSWPARYATRLQLYANHMNRCELLLPKQQTGAMAAA